MAFVGACSAGMACAQTPLLAPFAPAAGEPAQPWHVVGLPRQTKPFTKFSVVEIDGRRALRVVAEESYGNLVHSLNLAGAGLKLSWQWRVDRLVAAANLRERAGDDVALKVCVLFDEPLSSVPFLERQVLRVARSQSAEPLPAATVCYVWDGELPAGSSLNNAFTTRLRYIVLQNGPAKLQQWIDEQRDISADFMKLFGSEVSALPPVIGIAVGADADNTHGRSLGFVANLVLQP